MFSRTGRLARVGAVAVSAAAAFSLLSTMPASAATSVGGSAVGGKLAGKAAANSSKAKWSLKVKDASSNKYCNRAKVIIDRWGNDREYYGPMACGKGKLRKWNASSSFGQDFKVYGVKIHLCKTTPKKTHQTCKRVGYVKT